jgi:hypothetical protein
VLYRWRRYSSKSSSRDDPIGAGVLVLVLVPVVLEAEDDDYDEGLPTLFLVR